MNSETEAALLARYKALCECVDDYRNRGMQDEATALVQSEVKMVLDLLCAKKPEGKPTEAQDVPDRQ